MYLIFRYLLISEKKQPVSQLLFFQIINFTT